MDIKKISKQKAKVIAAVLCVCLIVGLSINQAGFLHFTRADIWDGNVPSPTDNEKYSGDGRSNGSKSNPYILGNAKDLIQFSVNVNAGKYYGQSIYVNLTCDVDLASGNWIPIGTTTNPFVGEFNGGAHKIKGMKLTIGENKCPTGGVGLFGATQDSTVNGIELSGTISQGTQQNGTNVGGLIGTATRTTVKNCTFSGNVVGHQYVGGLIGKSEGTTATKCQVVDCSVLDNSTIRSTNYNAGGLVGYAASYVRVINCFNRAAVTLDSNNTANINVAAGGVIGGTGSGNVDIINCYNVGDVTSSYLAGGIANGSNLNLLVCYNAGNVQSTGNGAVGGILSSSDNSSTLKYCFYKSGSYGAYPQAFSGMTENIGTFSDNYDYTCLVAESTKWDLGTDKTLLAGLNDGISKNANTYDGKLWQWGYAPPDSSYVVNKGYPIYTSVEAHVHNRNGKEEIIKEATCTEDGSVRYICSICGNPEVVTIPKKGHAYQEKIITPAACEVSGVAAQVCTNCGDEQNNWEIKPTGHRWKEGVRHEPTCVTNGAVRTECQNTGCTSVRESVPIPKLGHDATQESVAATCTSERRVITTCNRCDLREVEIISGSALGHDWDSVSGVSVSSTCTVHGGLVRTCKRCKVAQNVTDADGNEIIYPLADHTYKDEIIRPTCKEDGYIHHVCEVCGDIFDEYVDKVGNDSLLKLPHSYVATIVKPTCIDKGYTRHQCSRCDEYYDDTEIDATGKHSYSRDENQSILAGCESEGLDVFVCESCGHTIEEVLSNLGGHQYRKDEENSVPQTCEKGGYELWVCKRCLDEERRNETYKGFGHNYEPTVIPPKCLDGGYTIYTCNACGDSYIEDETEPIGHTYNPVIVPATTTERGYTVYTCINADCGESYESDYVAATPNASFDYATITLVLSDMDEVMKYSLNGGETWETVEVSAVALSAEAIDTEKGILVVRPGNDVLPLADSTQQAVTVVRAAEPVSLNAVQPSEDKPGMIVGVDSSMEYRKEGSEEWLPITSEILEGLEPAVYYIRVKATDAALASQAVMIEIKEEGAEPDETTAPPGDKTPGGPSTPAPTVPIVSPPIITFPATTPPNQTKAPNPNVTPTPNVKPTPTNGNGNSGNNGNNNGNNGNTGNNGNNNGNNGNTGNNNSNNNNNGNNSSDNKLNTNNGSSDNSSKTTSTPKIVENQVYYSSNGGASSNGGSSSTRTSTYRAAKTGDDLDPTLWLIIASTAVAAVVVTRKKKVEE